jgi:hypothetical protein
MRHFCADPGARYVAPDRCGPIEHYCATGSSLTIADRNL